MSSDSEMYTPKKEDSLRKINKPLMEKKRRARINHCLTQLKSLVLEAMKRDSTQVSKLEKADILEMTVNYLRNMQVQQQCVDSASDMRRNRYRTGFNECATEVMRYLGNDEGATQDVRSRLSDHLTKCVRVMNSKFSESGTYRQDCNGHTYRETLSVDIPVSRSNSVSIHNQNCNNGVYLLKTQSTNRELTHRYQQALFSNRHRVVSAYSNNMDNPVVNISPVFEGQGHFHRQITNSNFQGYVNAPTNSGNRTPTGNDDHINNNEAVWRPW